MVNLGFDENSTGNEPLEAYVDRGRSLGIDIFDFQYDPLEYIQQIVGHDEVRQLNRGSSKTAYLVGGNPSFVARQYVNAFDVDLLESERKEGNSEACYSKLDLESGNKYIAKIFDVPGLPLDLVEYCLNLASVEEMMSRLGMEKERASLRSLKCKNPLTDRDSRDCGLVWRGDDLFIVQFDLSVYKTGHHVSDKLKTASGVPQAVDPSILPVVVMEQMKLLIP